MNFTINHVNFVYVNLRYEMGIGNYFKRPGLKISLCFSVYFHVSLFSQWIFRWVFYIYIYIQCSISIDHLRYKQDNFMFQCVCSFSIVISDESLNRFKVRRLVNQGGDQTPIESEGAESGGWDSSKLTMIFTWRFP